LRYFTLFRYSTMWVEDNMGTETPALKWRIIVADIRGGGEQWLAGGSVVDIVVGAITASASAALNKGKI
ncbi:MAG: hypothetical protein K8F30_04000, partial [Taibaiella sp.]|nr:hypothetical protein [Taibaiella sp.]